jgi:hypothetical protein
MIYGIKTYKERRIIEHLYNETKSIPLTHAGIQGVLPQLPLEHCTVFVLPSSNVYKSSHVNTHVLVFPLKVHSFLAFRGVG